MVIGVTRPQSNGPRADYSPTGGCFGLATDFCGTMWERYSNAFKNYMRLERSLSENSIDAYLHDVAHLHEYIQLTHPEVG
ncbi:MAG TPA: site-specific integrase, partial [Fibrella sp.]